MSSLDRYRILDVSCGYYFSVFLTMSHRVLSCGSNDQQQLGHSFGQDSVRSPKMVEYSSSSSTKESEVRTRRMVRVYAGMDFMASVDSEHTVWIYGMRFLRDCMGLTTTATKDTVVNDDDHDAVYSAFVDSFRSHSDGSSSSSRSRGCWCYCLQWFTLHEVRVDDLVCGESHVAVLSSQGRVYTFGSNKQGQIGNGNELTLVTTSCYTEPVLVCALERERVVSVKCGTDHCGVLCESAALYLWGCDAHCEISGTCECTCCNEDHGNNHNNNNNKDNESSNTGNNSMIVSTPHEIVLRLGIRNDHVMNLALGCHRTAIIVQQ